MVAWLEAASLTDGTLAEQLPPVRYISRRDGVFHFEAPVPATLKPGAKLTLHVRTEAPGYKSPETVRQLVVKAPQ